MIGNRSVVSIEDLSDEDFIEVFETADRMLEAIESGKQLDSMADKIMATLFYEPSTRTRLSFESAMLRLGGKVLTVADTKSSSVSKGETLADTIRMTESYSDIIVIRHPLEGAARLASKFTPKPIINAGDGSGQHPTQTLLDLFTIRKEYGKVDGLKIALIGDLKYGRTVHSLLSALARYDVKVSLISPESLKIPNHVLSRAGSKIEIEESENLSQVLSDTDVFYMTRIQKERFTDQNEYLSLIGSYSLDPQAVANMKPGAIIMHPLPRVDEIQPDVDSMPQARYFKQASYGVPVRMSLIALLLGGVS